MLMPRTPAMRIVSPAPRNAAAAADAAGGQRPAQGAPAVLAEITAGLLAPSAAVSPKFFYDSLGSRLFEAICELPEYYPTRTEAAIFARHGSDIARAVGTGCTLIDLGAGNCAKAAALFPLLQPAQYVPVDISRDFLADAVRGLQQRFPEIGMLALGLDFSQGCVLPDSVRHAQRLFFYPGSSIGNFGPDEAQRFLRGLRDSAGEQGGLLIGVDLVKDTALLDAAYDDALGVTAAFNLNLLHHLNHLAGADFDVRHWLHRAFFNEQASRIEMHLEARHALSVRWQGGERHFGAGERIHTEYSYKYTRAGFVALLERAGFEAARIWTDPDGWFAVIHARAAGARA